MKCTFCGLFGRGRDEAFTWLAGSKKGEGTEMDLRTVRAIVEKQRSDTCKVPTGFQCDAAATDTDTCTVSVCDTGYTGIPTSIVCASRGGVDWTFTGTCTEYETSFDPSFNPRIEFRLLLPRLSISSLPGGQTKFMRDLQGTLASAAQVPSNGAGSRPVRQATGGNNGDYPDLYVEYDDDYIAVIDFDIHGSGFEYEDAHVQLVGCEWAASGCLEVLVKGQWGTVCDDGFSNTAARVVCAQLGLPTEEAVAVLIGKNPDAWSSLIGDTSDLPILMDDVSCSGTEAKLQSCEFSRTSDCSHYEDVAIICTDQAPPVQLYGLKLGMACQFDSDCETQLCASITDDVQVLTCATYSPYKDSPYCFASFLAPGILVTEGNQVTRTTSSPTECWNLCEALGDGFFNLEHDMDALDDPFTYAATTCTNDIEAYRRMDNHQQLSGAVACWADWETGVDIATSPFQASQALSALDCHSRCRLLSSCDLSVYSVLDVLNGTCYQRSYSSLTALQQLPVPRTGAVLCADKSEVVSSISDSTAQAVLGKYDIESCVKFVGEILEVGTKKMSAACAAQWGLSENCTGFTYIEVPADTWVTGSREERPQKCIMFGDIQYKQNGTSVLANMPNGKLGQWQFYAEQEFVQLAKAQSGIKKQTAVAVRQFDVIFDMDYAAVMGNMDKFKEDVKAAMLESLGDKADVEVVSVVAGSVVATAQASFAGASGVDDDAFLSATPVTFPQAFKQLYNVNSEQSLSRKEADSTLGDDGDEFPVVAVAAGVGGGVLVLLLAGGACWWYSRRRVAVAPGRRVNVVPSNV
eukprot:gene19372-26020_t